MFGKQKGITLIALVITIIVLLILAGVTIAMVVGENGIIKRSNEAKNNTEVAKMQEEIDLIAADYVAEYHSKDYGEVQSNAGDYVASKLNILSSTKSGLTLTARSVTYENGQYRATGTIQNDGSISWNDASNTVGGGETFTFTTADYGKTVEYSTSLNNVELNEWKIFHIEGDYVWLISSDYLSNSAIPSSIGLETSGSYAVKSSTSRSDLITKLTTTSNWSDLINNGSIKGTALSSQVKEDPNVKAMGSPTMELYKNSWNAKYPTNQIYTTTNALGYFLSVTNDPPTYSETSVDMSGSLGYPDIANADTLYYPHADSSAWQNTNGYWLGSPSAYDDLYMLYVSYDGKVTSNRYNRNYYACRPVICLPSSVIE
ncbi:MAG: hypothetical protein IKF52_03265 [Clostridia bacterium]|nr:hypothetical protein [Clostridia bacterium]